MVKSKIIEKKQNLFKKIQHTTLKQKSHGEPDGLPELKKWADSVTADHKILNEEDQSRAFDKVALIIYDRFTQWLQAYACSSKSAERSR